MSKSFQLKNYKSGPTNTKDYCYLSDITLTVTSLKKLIKVKQTVEKHLQ